jgi:hypothetical protein
VFSFLFAFFIQVTIKNPNLNEMLLYGKSNANGWKIQFFGTLVEPSPCVSNAPCHELTHFVVAWHAARHGLYQYQRLHISSMPVQHKQKPFR